MFTKTRPAVQFLMLEQLTRATTLLWNGTVLGWKFDKSSIGASHYYRGKQSPEGGPSLPNGPCVA